MSIESFVRAMPKVELFVHFDGAYNREALLIIADQNDVPDNLKNFKQWAALLDKPDLARLPEIQAAVSKWIMLPEDLTRLVYELGVSFAKQNVRYAEVSLDPITLMESTGLTFEQLLIALNDGRDRVQRGWRVQMAWILLIPRDQPRKADDVLRWATSTAAKKGGVVAIGLDRSPNGQPFSQFERALKSAEKKLVPRVIHAGDDDGAESIREAIERLSPDRLLGGWGIADSPEVLNLLVEQQTPVAISIAREVAFRRIDSYAAYPLRRLLDEGVKIVLGSDMPSFYKCNLNDEYRLAVEQGGLLVEELSDIALNAVNASLLPDDEKQTLLETFRDDYDQLRAEHITAQAT